ncbi:MAG: NAD(P)/FAD-dependent oxidoreductase [Pyrobaculum sp.]
MRVVILGGGIAAVFTALFLEERGFRVVKIGGEVAYPLASLVLTHSMPNREDVELSIESLSIYRRFVEPREVTSIDILPRWVDLSSLSGVRHEVTERIEGLRLNDGEIAVITKDYLIPVRKVVKRLRRELGFLNAYGLLKVRDGRAHVVADGERVEGDVVVLAAGYRNKLLAEKAGVTMPLMPYECYAAVCIASRNLWRYSIGDYILGWYGRPAVPPLYIAGNGCGKFGQGPPPRYGEKIGNLISQRGGKVIPLYVKTGYCEVGPHGGPLYGRHPEVENLYVIGGLNGYGGMVGPALARRLADIITDRGRGGAFRIENIHMTDFNPCGVQERHEWRPWMG